MQKLPNLLLVQQEQLVELETFEAVFQAGDRRVAFGSDYLAPLSVSP